MASFADHAVTTVGSTALATLYEVAFISLQLGAWAGLCLLDENRSLFARTSAARRLIAEFGGLSSACLWFAAAGCLGPIGWTLMGAGFSDWEFPLRLIGATVHLVAIGLVLLHLPLGHWTRLTLLPLATWVLPALVGPEAALHPWIQRVFGVAGQVLPDGLLTPSQVAYDSSPWAQAATLLGWLVLAWATVPSRARDYALRDPR